MSATDDARLYVSALKCSDAELERLLADWPSREAKDRTDSLKPPQLFVEGPFSAGFDSDGSFKPSELSQLWTVRSFDETRELYARRSGFDTEQPWMVRVIGPDAFEGNRTLRASTGDTRQLVMDRIGTRITVQSVQPEGPDEQPLLRWVSLTFNRQGGAQ